MHCQASSCEAVWKSCIVQALIERIAKKQGMQAARKNCFVQALIESIENEKVGGAKTQGLKAARKHCVVQALTERLATYAGWSGELFCPSFD